MAKTYKLQGANLEYVAEYMSANKKIGSTKWHIETSAKNTGEQLCGILQGVYPGFKRYDKGFGWGDFNMIFENSVKRDEAYNDCNAAVNAYRNDPSNYGVQTIPGSSGNGNSDNGNSGNGNGNSGNDGKGGNGEAPDYTTYIIIGLSVLLIVLLLMKRKKK